MINREQASEQPVFCDIDTLYLRDRPGRTALTSLYEVSLNDLVRYNPEQEGLPIGPKDKHIFGTATINERGQIVLPKKARVMFGLKAGDTLIVLGNTDPLTSGLALVSEEAFHRRTGGAMSELLGKMRGDEE